MVIKPISFLIANLVAKLMAMLVAQCEPTLRAVPWGGVRLVRNGCCVRICSDLDMRRFALFGHLM